MPTISLYNVFKKYQLAIFSLTFFLCSLIFILVASYTLETYANRSITILTRALSERIQPALVFNDRTVINSMVKNFAEEYPIRSIEITNLQGKSLAKIEKNVDDYQIGLRLLDKIYFNTPVKVPIMHDQQEYGELTVYSSSSTHASFFRNIILGMSLGFFVILAILSWTSNSIYQYLMRSIKPIVKTAQTISEQKNYNIRLKNSNITEFQEINSVFNELLEKIQASNNKLQDENLKLYHQSRHDELTQLPNRHYFYQKLLDLFDNNQINNTVLLFIDNNNFKEVNDQYGHLAGDAVLQEMAIRLRDNLRQDDFIARLGGDEFAILLNNVRNNDNLISICEHLLSSCKNPISYMGADIYFSFSIGIALGENIDSPEALIAEADLAMYKAKSLPNHWYITD